MNKKSSSTSFWQKNLDSSELSPLTENINTDVCIVGGGITGLTSAYLLLKSGKKVIVLDSKHIGDGETGNTSAHLSNALDDGYVNIIKMHGIKKAILAAESHTVAINKIEEICQVENILCDFSRVDGILFAKDQEDEKKIIDEFNAAKRCGLDVILQDDTRQGKCLIFKNQAQFHPVKYLKKLTMCIIEMGGEIYEKTPVQKIVEQNLHVVTSNNKRVSARKIITAVDGQLYVPLKMHFKLNPQRSYVIGIPVLKNSIEHKLYWDTAEPYHYTRLQKLNNEQDLLIVGGEDHRVGALPRSNPYMSLFSWAKHQFRNKDMEVTFQWSGQILEPIDYLAYIGFNPKNKNILIATGDSGHGLTHGTIAGMLFTDLIMEKSNSWEKLYKLNRLPIRAIKSLISNILSSIPCYLKYLFPALNKLPNPGEGKIVFIFTMLFFLLHGLCKIKLKERWLIVKINIPFIVSKRK